MKLKVFPALVAGTEADGMAALEKALAGLGVRIARTARGRILLDAPEGEEMQKQIQERLGQHGFSLEPVQELSVKPVLDGILEVRSKSRT